MPARIPRGFNDDFVMLPLDRILPTRKVTVDSKVSPTCRRILASIREFGFIEPLVVYPQAGSSDSYILLDGHIRLELVRQRGYREVLCLIATDDEAFTYNHKVSQLSPIQEHFMILRAIEHGVSEERIAACLDVDVASIRQKRDLLKGICPEAVQLLRDKRAAAGALRELRKVKPMRQIEMAELMVALNNFSTPYAKCLLAGTPHEQLLEPAKAKDLRAMRPEDADRIEKEMQTLGQDFKLLEETHGRNVLNLVLCVGYLRKLFDNAAVVRYLSEHYQDILSEFRKIVDATNLEGTG